jgi:hypothetical protein
VIDMRIGAPALCYVPQAPRMTAGARGSVRPRPRRVKILASGRPRQSCMESSFYLGEEDRETTGLGARRGPTSSTIPICAMAPHGEFCGGVASRWGALTAWRRWPSPTQQNPGGCSGVLCVASRRPMAKRVKPSTWRRSWAAPVNEMLNGLGCQRCGQSLELIEDGRAPGFVLGDNAPNVLQELLVMPV